MIRILFMFALVFAMGSAYGQIKVNTDGDVVVGEQPGSTPDLAGFKAYGSAELELALDAGVGAPDFSMQVAGITKGAFRYNTNLAIMEVLVDAASTTNGGMPGTARAITIDANNRNVGIGITPSEKLHVAGNILASGTVMSSDRSLKNNIKPLERGLDDIMKIKTYTFNYNGKAGIEATNLQFGVIAQELQEVAPELVGSFTYQITEDSADFEESKIVSEEEYLHVNSGALQFILIKAVQEQQEVIKALEARIARLESK